MKREILTYPITAEQVNEELCFFSQYFIGRGCGECEVMFGFAWGNDYYPGRDWGVEKIPLADLIAKVRIVEAGGYGVLSHDDLLVSIPTLPIEFLFCHESDIHIEFDEPGEITEYFYAHWKSRGYKPAEYLKTDASGPGECLRSE